jgi:hypothetical protein
MLKNQQEENMAKDIKKYGQILGEYKTIMVLAKLLFDKNLLEERELTKAKTNFNTQYSHYESMNIAIPEVEKYLIKTNKLHLGAAKNILQFIVSQKPKTPVVLKNMSKKGLSSIKTAKSDLDIVLDGETISVSLKQYEKSSSVQLCSGTFLSTICSLSYERIGNGKFQDKNGNKFLSKNVNDVQSFFLQDYGLIAEGLIKKIKDLDNDYLHYKTMEIYPGDNVWLNTTTSVGNKGAEYISNLLKIVEKKSLTIKENILKRTGLNGSHEILIVANHKDPKIYSTLTDKSLKDKIRNLNDKKTLLKINKKKQGVEFSFVNNDKTIISLLMPCTINKNGAWHLPKVGNADKYCNKSKKWVKPNHLRPVKAKEMYTSTNFYLDFKKI